MRVLITGGSGFIGTNLVRQFIAHRDDVTNLDIREPRDTAQLQVWKRVNLLDSLELSRAVHNCGPDVIFHMGARTDLYGTSLADYVANTEGVRNLIEAVKSLEQSPRLVFASSRLVCRIGYQPQHDEDYCPTTIYGESKMSGEMIVRKQLCETRHVWTIVRPTSIWGPWFDVPYKDFFLAIAGREYLHPRGARVLKSFGYVGNTVYQLEKLGTAPEHEVRGKTLYLADYPPIDVAEFASAIAEEIGVGPIRTVRKEVLVLLARIGDCLRAVGWRNPPITTFRLSNLLTPMVHDLTDLSEIVGKLPYSMKVGVQNTVMWLRATGQVA